MVKQPQTNCLSVFDHFLGLALKRLDYHLEMPFEITRFHFQSVLASDLESISMATFDFFC